MIFMPKPIKLHSSLVTHMDRMGQLEVRILQEDESLILEAFLKSLLIVLSKVVYFRDLMVSRGGLEPPTPGL